MQTCFQCDKPATVNVQKCWVKWPYNAAVNDAVDCPFGEPEILSQDDSDDNLFFCAEHYAAWERGAA